MRNTVAILGTLLIAAVLIISGSAVAGWYYAIDVDNESNCENSDEALGEQDTVHATIGTNIPVPTLGEIILTLGVQTGMLYGEEFTIYASSTVKETYSMRLLSGVTRTESTWWRECDDTTDEDFTAPLPPYQETWCFVEIYSEEGSTNATDQIYGSEIDAVGWEQP